LNSASTNSIVSARRQVEIVAASRRPPRRNGDSISCRVKRAWHFCKDF
jgi:hypothetical protein